MREKWKAENPDRQKEILMRLSRGDSGFTELYEGLKIGWSRQTLSLYLTDLVDKNYIKKVPRGKREIYSLERDDPHVKELLERVDIRELYKIKSEVELLDDWIESMKFSLLNIIQCYMEVGMVRKEHEEVATELKSVHLQKFLVGYISDLVEVCKYYGEFLAEEIKVGDLDPNLVWEARNVLLEEIKIKRKK